MSNNERPKRETKPPEYLKEFDTGTKRKQPPPKKEHFEEKRRDNRVATNDTITVPGPRREDLGRRQGVAGSPNSSSSSINIIMSTTGSTTAEDLARVEAETMSARWEADMAEYFTDIAELKKEIIPGNTATVLKVVKERAMELKAEIVLQAASLVDALEGEDRQTLERFKEEKIRPLIREADNVEYAATRAHKKAVSKEFQEALGAAKKQPETAPAQQPTQQNQPKQQQPPQQAQQSTNPPPTQTNADVTMLEDDEDAVEENVGWEEVFKDAVDSINECVKRTNGASREEQEHWVSEANKYDEMRREAEEKLREMARQGVGLDMTGIVTAQREVQKNMSYMKNLFKKKKPQQLPRMSAKFTFNESTPFPGRTGGLENNSQSIIPVPVTPSMNATMSMTMNPRQFKERRALEESYLDQNTILDDTEGYMQEEIDWSDLFNEVRLKQYYDENAEKDIVRDTVRGTFDGEDPAKYRAFKELVHAKIVMKRNMSWFDKMITLKDWTKGNAHRKIMKFLGTQRGFVKALKTLDRTYGSHHGEAAEQLEQHMEALASMDPVDIQRPNTIDDMVNILEELVDLNIRARKDPRDGEDHVLGLIKMTHETKQDYQAFKTAKFQSRNSLKLFFTWAKEKSREGMSILKARNTREALKSKMPTKSNSYQNTRPRRNSESDFKSKYKKMYNRYGKDAVMAAMQEEFEQVITDESDSEDETVMLAKPREPCFVCDTHGHKGLDCPTWDKHDLKGIVKKIKEAELCPRCLKGRHSQEKCKSKVTCISCGSEGHHTKIHAMYARRASDGDVTAALLARIEERLAVIPKIEEKLKELTLESTNFVSGCPGSNQDGENDGEEKNEVIALTATDAKSWRTVPVEVSKYPDFRDSQLINMVLDEGSSLTIIDPKLDRAMDLEGRVESLSVHVVGDKSVQQSQSRKAEIYLRAPGARRWHKLKTRTFGLPAAIEPVDPNLIKTAYPEIEKIKFPKPVKGQVQMLLGFDNLQLMRSIQDIYVMGGPLVRKTPLGWTMLYHPKHGGHEVAMMVSDWAQYNAATSVADSQLDFLWDRTMGIEALGIDRDEKRSKRLNLAEETALKKMQSSITRDKNGNYVVDIMWIDDDPRLPKNWAEAKAVQAGIDLTHKKDKDVYDAVIKTMKEYAEMGIIEKIPDEMIKNCYFMPFFCIPKRTSLTTKYRFVYNAKQKFQGVSINDRQYTGPNFLEDIYDVLLKFRFGKVGVAADIEKMYLQIGVPEKDRKYLGIWVFGEAYQFTRWPFGLKAAPSVANFVIKYHLDKYGSKELKENIQIYMDDMIVAYPDAETATRITLEATELLKQCGMNLRKFVSNSKEVLKHIPEEYQEKTLTLEADNEDAYVHSTLGLAWDTESDTLGFRFVEPNMEKVTKRNMLTEIAKVFDPLGILAPFVIAGRECLQMICQAERETKIKWDTDLTKLENGVVKKALQKFGKWIGQLKEASGIRYPRKVADNPKEIQLHMCSDGSDTAFATTAMVEEAGKVALLTTKAKLQQIKKKTIPKIELAGGLMSARLATRLREMFKIPKENIHFWIDNKTALCWIRKPGVERDVYIRNRTIEINDTTNINEWNYINTKDNGADLPSRGATIEEMKADKKYWTGPDWMAEAKENWPKFDLKVIEEELLGEMEKVFITEQSPGSSLDEEEDYQLEKIFMATDEKVWEPTISVNQVGDTMDHAVQLGGKDNVGKARARFIRLKKLKLRENAYRWPILVRAIARIKSYPERSDVIEQGSMARAVRDLIILAQWIELESEITYWEKTGKWQSKELRKYAPVFDGDGILRVRSRNAKQRGMAQSRVYPIFLTDTWIFRLWTWQIHKKERHLAMDPLWLKLTQKFGGPKVRKMAMKVSNQCPECTRYQAKLQSQLMGPTPELEMEKIRPCNKIAMDFTGHYWVKMAEKKVKAYILVTVCLQTKVVTLETMLSRDTDGLILAMERITARRGNITTIFSDNEGSFEKLGMAVNRIPKKGKRETKHVDWKRLQLQTATEVLEWYFNPPRDHEANGLAEAHIKLTKKAMRTCEHGTHEFDEFRTRVAVAEDIMNARPIAVLKEKDGWSVITPNDLIIGRAPEAVFMEVGAKWSQRIGEIAKQITTNYEKWSQYYLQTFHTRAKWYKDQENLKEGDRVVVAVEELKSHRPKWAIGTVNKTLTSDDGKVRTVIVKMFDGTYLERGVRQLALCQNMPIIDNDQ